MWARELVMIRQTRALLAHITSYEQYFAGLLEIGMCELAHPYPGSDDLRANVVRVSRLCAYP